MKTVLFVILFTLVFCQYADAAPSISGEPGPKEYVNKPAGISAQDYHAMTTGTKTVVVILVDFPSADASTSGSPKMNADDITNIDIWFKTDSKNFEDYYSEASYTQLTLDVTFSVYGGTKSSLAGVKSTQCFTMLHDMSYYGADTGNSLTALVKSAIFESDVDNSDYDYVIVAHAGNGNESTQNSGDIWSVSVGWTGADQNGFYTGAIVPARESGSYEPLGVMCHEFGHQLGLPDIYAPDTGVTRVGAYALMDSGPWNDNGKTPPHFCSWSKNELGWINQENITGDVQNQTLKTYYNNAANSVFKFVIPGTDELEYFLLSYRKKDGYDFGLPEEGPVVLHIDESIATETNIKNNTMNDTTQPHPGVDIVGDGVWDTSEMFTAPDSNSYDGSVSGITIFGFAFSGSGITFNATIAEFADTVSFKERPLNFPNPAAGVSATTISFKLSSPETEKIIRIYTPAGELVKTIYTENIIARYVRDNEIVYQADWNLKNEAGEDVGSGIYVYLVEAGSKKKFGRLAVIKK